MRAASNPTRHGRWRPIARQLGLAAAGMIVALMLSAAVALALQLLQRATDAQAREALTLERMERIRVALCAYHQLHGGFNDPPGRLPGLSSPVRVSPPIEPTNLRSGALPPLGWVNPDGAPSESLKRLGLGPEDVTDGWGRLIAVRLSNHCDYPDIPVDRNGDGEGDDNACVVLVSHGRTGRGAASPQASSADQLEPLPIPNRGASPTNGEGAEWRNTRRIPPNHDYPYQTVAPRCTTNNTNPDSPCHFDDVVTWFSGLTVGPQALCR